MSHNTFDVEKTDIGFLARSHNYGECYGEGATEKFAIEAMNRKILYIKDNDPVRFKNNIRDRIKKGLICHCGVKLNDDDVIIGTFGN